MIGLTNSNNSVTSQEHPEALLEFSEEEIRHGVHRFPFKKILRGSPINSLLYAVLCAVHEGILTREELNRHLGCLFSTQLRRSSIVPADVDEAIQHGINEQSFSKKQDNPSSQKKVKLCSADLAFKSSTVLFGCSAF